MRITVHWKVTEKYRRLEATGYPDRWQGSLEYQNRQQRGHGKYIGRQHGTIDITIPEVPTQEVGRPLWYPHRSW